MGGLGRRPLEVRPHRPRPAGRRRAACAENELLDSFELLHFHLGSPDHLHPRGQGRACARRPQVYVDLVELGAPLRYLDVGGGLGVDYDGSQTNFTSSLNYTLQEYANDIVFGIMEVCDARGRAAPDIVSESGRATVAHHAVLVIDVLGVAEFAVGKLPRKPPADAEPVAAATCSRPTSEVSRKNLLESYHDAISYRGRVPEPVQPRPPVARGPRALAEDLFWATCQKILQHRARRCRRCRRSSRGSSGSSRTPTSATSRSSSRCPTRWAIDQLFPIVPIHRLNEEPTQPRRAGRHHLRLGRQDRPLHRPPRRQGRPRAAPATTGEPYYLGVFLVGAYQEILGDLHNLFGDTNTVHVSLDQEDDYRIEDVVNGDTVTDVLRYVRYNRDDLVARVRRAAEAALRAKRITLEESGTLLRRYEEGLSGYTYLEQD